MCRRNIFSFGAGLTRLWVPTLPLTSFMYKAFNLLVTSASSSENTFRVIESA